MYHQQVIVSIERCHHTSMKNMCRWDNIMTILWSSYPKIGIPALVKLYPVMNLLPDAVSFLLVERCEVCQSLTCYTVPYASHANPFSLQFRIYVCQWAHACLLTGDWWAQTWHVCKNALDCYTIQAWGGGTVNSQGTCVTGWSKCKQRLPTIAMNLLCRIMWLVQIHVILQTRKSPLHSLTTGLP